jgi:hypothetical protein
VGCTLVATGSAAWTKLGCPIPKDVKGRIDKLSLFETLSDDWMDEVLAGEAVLEAIEAEKYENGTNHAWLISNRPGSKPSGDQ